MRKPFLTLFAIMLAGLGIPVIAAPGAFAQEGSESQAEGVPGEDWAVPRVRVYEGDEKRNPYDESLSKWQKRLDDTIEENRRLQEEANRREPRPAHPRPEFVERRQRQIEEVQRIRERQRAQQNR